MAFRVPGPLVAMLTGRHVVVIVLLLALAAFLAWLVPLYLRYKREEREAAQQWAREHGWEFVAKDPALTKQWRERPILGVGMATNILRGTVPEGEVVTFDRARTQNTLDGRVAVLRVGRELPTLVGGTHARRPPATGPSVSLDLSDRGLNWWLLTYTEEDAEEVRNLLDAAVCTRLREAAADRERDKWIELTFEGRDVLLSFTEVTAALDHEGRIALLRDLARLMRL